MLNKNVFYCGYSIGAEGYKDVTKICRRYGSRVLLIVGEKALLAGKPLLEKALEFSKITIVESVPYGKECTHAQISKLAQLAIELDVDMIFGMGGGKALDTAKGAAWEAELPIFTFPTIAATCAATTAL